MAEPFYLYIRRKGGNYYVQFRLEDGSLSNHKSTGTPNYNEARKLAMQWYSSGQIPERINSISEKHKMSELEKVQLIKQLKIYDFEYEDIQTIVDILVSRNFLVSGILKASPESRQAVDYLLEFWDYDKSSYREERAVLGKNLSYSYFETALGRVKKYWAPRLEGKLLAMYTGMRADEVLALRVCDIHDNYIWISHGWDDHVGLKPPKNGEERPAPISDERNPRSKILKLIKYTIPPAGGKYYATFCHIYQSIL